MTTLLLTTAQYSALSNAKQDHLQALFLFSNRWRVNRTSPLWHAPTVINQLVAAGLMRRIGAKRVQITEAGYDAIDFHEQRRQRVKLPVGAKTLKQLAAEANEPVPEITHNADGSIEFNCAGCGQHVFQAVDDGFGFPACFECRWFDEHPQIRKPEMRA
ncbi:hypothetical protein [Bradyrhizobium sp. 191]|uniref:hypothetical protein n=1 Tax=Bradyrhizobium sp. 191 TaxID=2782659 RepID=UPI001FFFEE81|nr:hypothetical protein [Bradyrhizobium sp. 191]UPJ65258.1 hypothetical protein IVB23_35935 [Bradyrhizobium sp. 191]